MDAQSPCSKPVATFREDWAFLHSYSVRHPWQMVPHPCYALTQRDCWHCQDDAARAAQFEFSRETAAIDQCALTADAPVLKRT